MNDQQIRALRAEKNHFFKHSPHTPLSPEQQDKFNGLNFYDPNPELEFVVEVTRVPISESTITIETTTGDSRRFVRYGTFTFEIDGQPQTLTVYSNEHGFFLPFIDSNAGKETYPAGRYLEPEALADGRLHVDFNLAYNPFCAYGEGWSCPITPAENRLKVAIRAGEKNPDPAWVEA